jgi:hypothetical protein
MSLSNQYGNLRPSLLLDFANSETIDPRITFARASTARYYDQNTVAKAEENLLLQSQTFSNAAWSKTTITEGALATAPDGTATAASLTAAGANSTIVQSVTAAAGDHTFSVWLRRVTGTGNVDISAHSGGTWVTQTITSSWARYTVTQTLTAGARTPGIRIATSADAVEVWGAQLEQRSAATAYTATTTAPITRYQPQLMTAAAGVARLDHDPITREARGLLIEESRSNLMTFTEDLTNVAWVKTAASITANATVAPDGTLTADAVIENTATGVHRAQQVLSVTPNTYTISAYVKAAGRDVIRVEVSQPGETAVGVHYDLLNQVVSLNQDNRGVNPFIQSVGNGWLRVGVTVVQTGGGASSMYFYGMPRSLLTAGNSWTGDGYSGFFLWGAQIELAGFATSYIARLDATAASRAADAASMTGTNFSAWFRADEGTLYAEFNTGVTSATVDTPGTGRGVAAITDNTPNNRLRFAISTFLARAGGATVAEIYGAVVAAGTTYKTAAVYALNDYALSVNGVLSGTDTSGVLPTGLSRLDIGASTEAGGILNGYVRKLAFYPKRLANSQLQSLTR